MFLQVKSYIENIVHVLFTQHGDMQSVFLRHVNVIYGSFTSYGPSHKLYLCVNKKISKFMWLNAENTANKIY